MLTTKTLKPFLKIISVLVLCLVLIILVSTSPKNKNTLAVLNLTSVGNVYHVAQITGNGTGNTENRGNISGTDVGTMFTDFANDVIMAFGDTFGFSSTTGGTGSNWRNNTIAMTRDDSPSNGLDLYNLVFDTPNHAKTVILPRARDLTVIPNTGVSVEDKLYIQYMRVKQWSPGIANGAGIATSVDHGQTWTTNDIWSGTSNFVAGGMIKDGVYVYSFGIPFLREGCVKLARVSQNSITKANAYRYWNGSSWVNNENSAVCIVPAPVGELSVAYNNYLGQYIMLYLNETANQIQIRTSPSLTGSWSTPIKVTDTVNQYPNAYAPMLYPKYSSGQDIYFALSLWNPYHVYLIHAILNPSSTSWGPFDLPGRVETENYREGEEGIGYHDTTPGNNGVGYRNDDVDILFNQNEDAYTVGWVDNGEWLSYKVNVRFAGTYKFRLKYATPGSCQVQFSGLNNNPIYVPSTTLNSTGSYTDFTVWEPPNTFNLGPGLQYVTLYFPVGGCDVTYFEVYPALSGTTIRVNAGGSTYTDPAGKVWTADYGYSGGTTNLTSSAIENTVDDYLYNSGRYGNFDYTFPVTNGFYKVKLKFAETLLNSGGARVFNVYVENARRLINYDPWARAGGQNIAKDEEIITEVTDGTLNLGLRPIVGLAEISGIEITPANDIFASQRVIGHIESEDYRTGGEGIGYHDTTAGNTGSDYRGDDVDIRVKRDGGYQIGWTADGEWLSYHINVEKTSTYKLRLRYSAGGSGCKVEFATPDHSQVYIPATVIGGTGGWNFATWAPSNTFTLNAGSQYINMYLPVGSCDFDYFEIYQ